MGHLKSMKKCLHNYYFPNMEIPFHLKKKKKKKAYTVSMFLKNYAENEY